jgi:hypothetical protein
VEERGEVRSEEAVVKVIGRFRTCGELDYEDDVLDLDDVQETPKTRKVRSRASANVVDEAYLSGYLDGSEVPICRLCYAAAKNQSMPWPAEVLRTGWFPPVVENVTAMTSKELHRGFVVT